MMDFDALGRAAEALLHRDEVRLSRPVFLPDGMGGFAEGQPEDLGALRCSLQSYSAERAQADYGVACRAQRRLFCAPDARVQPGLYAAEADGTRWRIAAVPERCRSHAAALLEEVSPAHADGDRAGS